MKKTLEEIRHLVTDQRAGFSFVHGLRERFKANGAAVCRVSRDRENVDFAVDVLKRFLGAFERFGINLAEVLEPAHGLGHLTRDYINMLRLGMADGYPYTALIPGAVHDIGLAFVPRYEESGRIVRHAEASGIALWHILRDSCRDLCLPEIDLIAYGAAAHTHYLTPQKVNFEGEEWVIDPYQDMVDTGELNDPIMAGMAGGFKKEFSKTVFIPRWIDRLDNNGPYVGRHFLTLAVPHHDLHSTEGFYIVAFEGQTRPLLRTKEERGGDTMTMREHLAMYAGSQTNESPYGKWDEGEMVRLRDREKAQLERILAAVVPEISETQADMFIFTDKRWHQNREYILTAWTDFLATNVDPTPKSREVAEVLVGKFKELPVADQTAWLQGFRATMQEYCVWADDTLAFLRTVPEEWLKLPVIGDVRRVIEPAPSVRKM